MRAARWIFAQQVNGGSIISRDRTHRICTWERIECSLVDIYIAFLFLTFILLNKFRSQFAYHRSRIVFTCFFLLVRGFGAALRRHRVETKRKQCVRIVYFISRLYLNIGWRSALLPSPSFRIRGSVRKKIDAIQTSTKYLFRRFLRFARKSFSFHSSLHCDVDFTIRHGYGYIAIRNL